MRRLWLTAISLGMVCFWLIGSYLPKEQPIVSLNLPLPSFLMGGIAVVCFVSFLVIQVWILFSTRSALVSPSASQQTGLQSSLGLELFWTFLPIVLTLLLALGSWKVWQAY